MRHCRVEIEDVWGLSFCVEVRIESLHKGRLALFTCVRFISRVVPGAQPTSHIAPLTDPAMPIHNTTTGCFLPLPSAVALGAAPDGVAAGSVGSGWLEGSGPVSALLPLAF